MLFALRVRFDQYYPPIICFLVCAALIVPSFIVPSDVVWTMVIVAVTFLVICYFRMPALILEDLLVILSLTGILTFILALLMSPTFSKWAWPATLSRVVISVYMIIFKVCGLLSQIPHGLLIPR